MDDLTKKYGRRCIKNMGKENEEELKETITKISWKQLPGYMKAPIVWFWLVISIYTLLILLGLIFLVF